MCRGATPFSTNITNIRGATARKNRGIRTDRWKLIHFFEQPQEWELYDLKEDPEELRNLATSARHASVSTEMKSRLVAARARGQRSSRTAGRVTRMPRWSFHRLPVTAFGFPSAD